MHDARGDSLNDKKWLNIAKKGIFFLKKNGITFNNIGSLKLGYLGFTIINTLVGQFRKKVLGL